MSGRTDPVGNTVRKLGATTVLVAVTLSTTADTPLLGMFGVPVMCTLMVWPAHSCALGDPIPMRVSRTRFGTIGLYRPATGGVAVGVAT